MTVRLTRRAFGVAALGAAVGCVVGVIPGRAAPRVVDSIAIEKQYPHIGLDTPPSHPMCRCSLTTHVTVDYADGEVDRLTMSEFSDRLRVCATGTDLELFDAHGRLCQLPDYS